MIPARTSVLLVVALAAGACARRPPHESTTSESHPVGIMLERKPCYGTCPVYSLTISGDGHVFFEGRQHVDSVGKFSAHIDPDRLIALIRLFDEKQFFELDDRYVMGEKNCQPYATDAPTVITSLTARGQTKRVEHDAGCVGVPARLGEIERAIDQAAGVARWIGRRG